MLGVWCSGLLARSISLLMPLDVVWNGGPSLPVLAVTFGFCMIGTMCFALGPALKLSRSSVIGDLSLAFFAAQSAGCCANRFFARLAHRRSALHSRCE